MRSLVSLITRTGNHLLRMIFAKERCTAAGVPICSTVVNDDNKLVTGYIPICNMIEPIFSSPIR